MARGAKAPLAFSLKVANNHRKFSQNLNYLFLQAMSRKRGIYQSYYDIDSDANKVPERTRKRRMEDDDDTLQPTLQPVSYNV